jgi:hypothetical protein
LVEWISRNKGDMRDASMAVATTLPNIAWLSSAPARPGWHVDEGEPLLF